jgi:16S rRNA (guanine527-N7)-methyltransferase
MVSSELAALLEPSGLEPAIRERLARYGMLVLEMGRRFNLSGARSEPEIAAHLLDSLTVIPHVAEPYADVGSGAGFPAVPVAIATGIAVTMVEATTKKARFLESVLEMLGIRGRVVVERAEIAGHRFELREQFASGTARALGSASTVAELLLPLIAVDGAAVLQRGQISAAERQALDDAALMLGGVVEDDLGLNGDRRLLIVRKIRATAERFPRRPGVPAKRPLCIAPEKRSP